MTYSSRNAFDTWLNSTCETSLRAKSTIMLLQAIYAKDKNKNKDKEKQEKD